MDLYGIHVGDEFISVVLRSDNGECIAPVIIQPIARSDNRNADVSAAFSDLRKQDAILSTKGAVAHVSFESAGNHLFLTPIDPAVSDIHEMMSWELMLRCGEPVRNYNLSVAMLRPDSVLAAASRVKDVQFYTEQVKRLGLRVASIEPSIVSILRLFEQDYTPLSEAFVGLICCHRMILLYLKEGVLTDIAQMFARSGESLTVDNLLGAQKELLVRNELSADIPLYLSGELLSNYEYRECVKNEMIPVEYMNPFTNKLMSSDTDCGLLENYYSAFGVAVSLTQKEIVA